MSQDERADWLRLTLAAGVGAGAQRALLASFGLPAEIFAAGRGALAKVIDRPTIEHLLAPPDATLIAAALAWADEPGNHLITLADADYPRSLLEIADPPTLLYVKGKLDALARPALAIVGARSATPQGIANARAFARSLADTGLTIVSGLALGIDAAAHEGALDASEGSTVAVIGTGADRVYPARNRELAHRILEHGAIVSEFPLGTPPLRHNFPRRNRLLAGLSRGVLVVEAALNSGSLITARLAAETGREILAIPGSIHSPLARGCHRLIRDGAKLVETADDVLEELRWGSSAARTPEQAPNAHATGGPATSAPGAPGDGPPEAPEAAQLLATMGFDPVDIDTLAARSGLTLDALYAILLPLELDGHISRLPGGRFQRL